MPRGLETWKLARTPTTWHAEGSKGRAALFHRGNSVNPSQKFGCFETLTLATLASHQSSFDAAAVEVLGSAHDGCLELNAHGGACCNAEDSTLRKMGPCRRLASGTMQPQCFRNRYRIPSSARLLTAKAGPSDGRSAPLLYPATPALLPLHTTLFLRRPQLFSPKWKKCTFNQRVLFHFACGIGLSF